MNASHFAGLSRKFEVHLVLPLVFAASSGRNVALFPRRSIRHFLAQNISADSTHRRTRRGCRISAREGSWLAFPALKAQRIKM
jgi:hypothetical protein